MKAVLFLMQSRPRLKKTFFTKKMKNWFSSKMILSVNVLLLLRLPQNELSRTICYFRRCVASIIFQFHRFSVFLFPQPSSHSYKAFSIYLSLSLPLDQFLFSLLNFISLGNVGLPYSITFSDICFFLFSFLQSTTFSFF